MKNYEKDQCPTCKYCNKKCLEYLNDWCKYPEIGDHINNDLLCTAYEYHDDDIK